MTYAVLTLGCKLNQTGSAELAGRLGGAANELKVEQADLIFLNTCTVTHRADREARRLARAVRRANPRAKVVVMGCAARRDPAMFRKMPEVDAVLCSSEEERAFLEAHVTENTSGLCLPHFSDRTRAFLKVQDGCDFACSYCIIPAVRGRSRSVPEEQVVRTFSSFLEAGYKEVVLTGVNTGEYGKDLGRREGLQGLLERLLSLPGSFRIRLNSVEPRAVTDGLRGLLRDEPRLCRHLQIPLQSGSDAVLKDMRRNYRSGFYEDLIHRLALEIPGIGLGADVLVGFPTESREDFEATLALIERAPLAFVHAFPFSPRPGTPAAELAGLPPVEVSARSAALRALGAAKAAAFSGAMAGSEMQALTLISGGGCGRALTDNFLDVELSDPVPANRFVRVRVEKLMPGGVAGRVVQGSDESPGEEATA